eukprot:comp19881_c0_seq1/m.24050 comp19881_c0_seq1/g.24050  ORF comp19881_c0_seq1/g.24050 comp19881_c0_seq1/m.24050 type:complete len:360 (-) comp19881_c0_seq1:252-1331(-)
MKCERLAFVGVLALTQTLPTSASLSSIKPYFGERSIEDLFSGWMLQHNVTLSSPAEYVKRLGNFQETLKRIQNYDGSFTVGLNRFSHLSADEFRDFFGRNEAISSFGSANGRSVCDTNGLSYTPAPLPTHRTNDLPELVDWRMKQCFTPVKAATQDCHSSYALATTATVEAYYALEGGKLTELSAQQVLDCSTSFGARGCGGGTMGQAYQHIKTGGGLETAADYPLKAGQYKCAFEPKKIVANVTDVMQIKGGMRMESDMMKVVASNGPVTVAFNFHTDLQLYTGGVYSSRRCSDDPSTADYTGVVVGYKTTNTENYWIIRASFGDKWGLDGGYFYIAKDENMCGINGCGAYPKVRVKG